jgi:putative membrane protein
MRGFLTRVLISAFGLWIADMLLAGVRFDGAGPLFLAALLLGLVNAVVRPIVIVLTLPITLLSLGLFMFVINGAMLLLVARLMPSFHLEGLGTAIVAWLIVALTSWVANAFIGNRGRVEVIRR